MSLEVKVRPYEKGDEKQIIPLLDIVFKDWLKKDFECTPQEHYEWLYWDCPEGKNSTVVAEENGKIIGVNHGIYLHYKIGKKVFLGLKSTDLAVHPDYRGKGVSGKIGVLHTKIRDEAGVCIVIYHSSNPIVIDSNLRKGGGTFPGTIQVLTNIKDIDLYLNNLIKPHTWTQALKIKYGFIAIQTFNKLKKLLRGAYTPNRKDLKIVKVTKFDDRITTFWNQIKDEYDFIVEHTLTYLNWRFCDIRGGRYDTYQAEENGNILGFIVLGINRLNKDPEGYIMELQTLPKSPDIARKLLQTAADHFKKEKVNVIYANVVKEHPLEQLFYEEGFVDSRYKTFVGVNATNLGDEEGTFMNASHNRLDYQYGLSDTI